MLGVRSCRRPSPSGSDQANYLILRGNPIKMRLFFVGSVPDSMACMTYDSSVKVRPWMSGNFPI